MAPNIVLLHGVFGTRWWPLGWSDFNGLGRRLNDSLGARVLVAGSSPLGGIAKRAQELAFRISTAFHSGALDSAQSTHILAHSMGGLDARYMVCRNLCGLTPHISSVVCIGSPHFGSPVATAFEQMPFGSLAQMVLPIRELTVSNAETFNRLNPDVPTIKYFDVVGVGRQSTIPTAFLLAPLAFLISVSGVPVHDGVVPFKSACRGRQPFAVWHEDHIGLIGHNLDFPFASPATLAHLARFERLVREIAAGRLAD